MKKVRDLMSKSVIYFKPEDTIFKAAKIFSKKKISGAPVVEDAKTKKVIGVISETDIVKFMGTSLGGKKEMAGDFTYQSLTLLFFNFIRMSKNFLNARKEIDRISKIKIRDVMSKEVVFVSPDTNIFDAASKMDLHDVNRLPVLDKGKLVGIIARADLLKALL